MHNALQRIFYKISIVEQDRAFCSWVFPSFISHSSIGFFSRCSKHRSTIPFSSFYFLSSFPTDSKNLNFSGFLFLSSNLLCAQSLRRVWLFVTPWTVAHQAPLSLRILQAKILKWVAMPSSRGSSQATDQTQVFCIAGGIFIVWAIREAWESPLDLSFNNMKDLLN